MAKDFQKNYIECSTEFRNSNGSTESTNKLFDLLYELEKADRSRNENIILANIYSLLGFHQFAFEAFQFIYDTTNRNDIKKLYDLEQKAKSHGNLFAIKDIRNLRDKKKQPKLLIEEFIIDKQDDNERKLSVKNRDIIIFNKQLPHENLELYLYGEHDLKTCLTKIIDHLNWLADCKHPLIESYNSIQSEYTNAVANDDWYDTLDVFSTQLFVDQNGIIFSEIAVGDKLMHDHILDIQIKERTITEMSYDG